MMKSTLKRITAVLITIAMALTMMAGCSSDAISTSDGSGGQSASGGADSGKKLKIGIAMTTVADFDSYMVNGFNAYQKQHADELEIVISDANYDAAVQLSSVENFVSSGVDAIVLKAVDAQSCGPISEMCQENKIPLIVLNTPITSHYDSFVGSDNKECGVIQATYAIDELLKGKGSIAILYGDPSHDGSRGRTDGVKEIAAKNGVEVVDVQTGDWARDKGMSIAENWIQGGKKIDAILSNNDEMAIGAMMAYEDAGLDMIVLGTDALPEACDLIKEKRLAGSVFQDGYTQAQESLKVAMQAARGEEYKDYVDVPFELVTPDNVDDYIAKYASYETSK